MPVVQLQDDTGGNLGTALGAAAGYFATQKQRKADKQAATARQTALDSETAQRDKDYHDEITARIGEIHANQDRTAKDDATKQFQNGAYAHALALAGSSPPQGQDAQQWANAVWQKATQADPATGGLGLTDPDLLGKLRAQLEASVKTATAARAQQFVHHENPLPTDPKQLIPFLWKRYEIERGIPGVDIKGTQQLITDVQKNQGKQLTPEQQYFQKYGMSPPTWGDINLPHGPQARGGRSPDDAQAGSDVGARLGGAKTRQAAQAILDGPEGQLLSDHQYTRFQAEIDHTFGTHQEASRTDKPPAEKPRPVTSAERESIQHDADKLLSGGMPPDAVKTRLSRIWAMPGDQANEYVLGSHRYVAPTPGPTSAAPAVAAPTAAPAAAPPAPPGGQKRTVSLKAAMALPSNRGKSPAQVQADIAAHGYSVVP